MQWWRGTRPGKETDFNARDRGSGRRSRPGCRALRGGVRVSRVGAAGCDRAVRKFVDTVDEKLPSLGDEHPSRRQDIIDAALEMADQLVHTEYDFLRKVAHSAGKALGRPDDGK